MEEVNRLVQMKVPSRRSQSSEGKNQDIDHKERRRQQNRIAQKKYRRKVSQQLKQTEEFALRAHQTLAQVAKSRANLWHCPECDHCKKSQISCQDGLSKLPMLSPAMSSSGPIDTNHGFANLTSPLQEGELQLSTSQQEFYNNDLSLSEMDFDSSFLEDHSLATILSSSCGSGFNPAAISTNPSKQTESPTTNNGAPPTPFSLQDFGNDFSPDMSQSDHQFSRIGCSVGSSVSSNVGSSVGSNENLSTTSSDNSLVTHGSTRNLSQRETAIHLAAREGYSSIISILLHSGAGVDSRDQMGRTPLHHCAENGHVEALKMLLESGADPSAVDDEGVSVILTAVKAGKEKVVASLVEVLGYQ